MRFVCGQLRYWPRKSLHDDVIKWKHFPRNWPFVRGIHRSPVNSPHKGQWRGAVMFSLICVWINDWGNNREAGDLRRYRAHYDVIVIISSIPGASVSGGGLIQSRFCQQLSAAPSPKNGIDLYIMMTCWCGCVFRISGPLEWNLLVAGGFPTQMVSSVKIWFCCWWCCSSCCCCCCC